MLPPLIGVTPSRNKKTGRLEILEAYPRSIIRAGGIPLVIPLEISEENYVQVIERLDGLLLTGGGDIDTKRFGGKDHPRVSNVEPLRDELEIKLTQLAVRENKPFLGICRGIQVINVALGGTLYTDIHDQFSNAIKHDCFPPDYARDHIAHNVRNDANSLLARSMGVTTVEVNSLHHQGLEKIAAELRVTAHAADELVEGVEIPGHPFGLGVQWHPECLPDSLPMLALFRAFMDASVQQKTRG